MWVKYVKNSFCSLPCIETDKFSWDDVMYSMNKCCWWNVNVLSVHVHSHPCICHRYCIETMRQAISLNLHKIMLNIDWIINKYICLKPIRKIDVSIDKSTINHRCAGAQSVLMNLNFTLLPHRKWYHLLKSFLCLLL